MNKEFLEAYEKGTIGEFVNKCKEENISLKKKVINASLPNEKFKEVPSMALGDLASVRRRDVQDSARVGYNVTHTKTGKKFLTVNKYGAAKLFLKVMYKSGLNWGNEAPKNSFTRLEKNVLWGYITYFQLLED